MLKRYLWRPALVAWLTGLLLAGLTLAACGSAATPPAAVLTTPASPVGAVTDTPAAFAGETQAAPTAAEKPTAIAETPAVTTSLPAKPQKPVCEAADPKTDPLTGAFELLSKYIDDTKPNPAIAAVTDKDWSKGPANAPVTIIEYGDFQ